MTENRLQIHLSVIHTMPSVSSTCYSITGKPPNLIVPKPPSQRRLERARMKREFEKKMWRVVKEVSFYFVFLILVSFIAWGPQDDRVFKMNKHIKSMFQNKDGRLPVNKVSQPDLKNALIRKMI